MTVSAKTVALVANGAIDDLTVISPLIKSHDYIIAVDGGLVYCDKMNIFPTLIIGDLDSLPSDLLAKYSHIPVSRYPVDKNETDMELALRIACKPGVERVTLFGALGNRIDHTMYNLYLLQRYSNLTRIETERETLFCVTGPTNISCYPGQTISFFPHGELAAGIFSKGLKWELSDATFNKDFMSISNVCLSDLVHIDVKKGILLCSLLR